MRVVIDMQGAQAINRSRGIGRYTMSLTQAIVRNRGEHEIILALSDMFPESIESIRAAFDGLLPQENILVWHALSPVRQNESGNGWRLHAAESIRAAFFASLKPDVIHITSFFEGYADDAVTGIARLDQSALVSVTFYDLIPLLNQEHYLDPDPVHKQFYLQKIEELRGASLLLAISESSRQEGIFHLGLAADKVSNISSAVDAHFRPLKIGAEEQSSMLQRYGIDRPFLLYVGGIDPRKNIERLIRAYALLPDSVRTQHQLVISCSIQREERIRLEALGEFHRLHRGELLLTGFVPEQDLPLLYNLCKAFVFPSWHEGFGLPALEAMRCGRAVIASDASSLPEVIGRTDALFDAKSEASIATKIEQVLIDPAFRMSLELHGMEHAERFSWM